MQREQPNLEMPSPIARRITPDELPSVHQKLRLICQACGQRHTYDVGTIYVWAPEGAAEPASRGYAFSKYFRCRACASAGPWEVADWLKLFSLTLLAKASPARGRLVFATPELFDGTIVQSPALGEEHLLRLIAQEPGRAFLCTRLGNLQRGCGRRSQAADWYGRALALDAGDIEARYHLFNFAVDDADHPAAIAHARPLVRHLLAGRETRSEELTRGLAVSVVETLRQAPPEVRDELGRVAPGAAASPEADFMRTLLEAEGDEEGIVNEAADRLLAGEALPAPASSAPLTANVALLENDDGASIDLIPSLRELVEQEGLDVRALTVAVATGEQGRICVKDRRAVFITDGERAAVWEVRSLRELFRGDRAPPPDMERPPPEYDRCFFTIEKHVLTACDIEGDRTDQEMEAIYSALRRRPDGRSHLGPLHDFLWQAAALTLGLQRLSEAEFASVVGQLERAVRRRALRPVSRNYVRDLREE